MALIFVAVFGAVLVVAGVGWVFPPAGLVVAGVMLMVGAWLVAEEVRR